MSKPLLYYVISLIIGLLSSILFLMNYLLLGAVFAASFFAVMFYTVPKSYFYIIVSVFCIGFINIYSYYSLPKSQSLMVRVLEERFDYYIGEYKNKKYAIIGIEQEIKEGVLVYGGFEVIDNPSITRGLVAELKVNEIYEVKKDSISKIYEYRDAIYNSFKGALGEKYAAIVSALCFGNTKYMHEDSTEELKDLGIIHLVSVSGFHTVLIFGAFKRFLGSNIAIIATLLFVLFTGAEASSLRAFLMLFITYLSTKLYKRYDPLSSLSLAVILILMFRPYYITSIGFNLSCLSTLGIILFNNKLNRILYKLPSYINNSLSLTLSSQSIAFPYAALSIKTFSPGFILGNIFLIPLYTIIIYLSFIALIAIKLPKVFYLINKPIKLLFSLVEGWSYLLLEITPDKVVIEKEFVVFYTLIFICLMLSKKYKKEIKYLPVVLLIPILLIDYHFIPSVTLGEIGNTRFIRVMYRQENIVFTTGKTSTVRNKLIGYAENPMIINIRDDQYTLNLSDKYTIKVNKIPGDNSLVALKISSNRSRNKIEIYDIINIKRKKKSYDYGYNELAAYMPLKSFIYKSVEDRGIELVGD